MINIDVTGTIKNDATIQLINVLGQVVYTTSSHNHRISISTEGLTNGIYSLVYNIGDNKKIEKVVINK